MIEISSLSGGYGNKEILHNVTLQCEKGKITTLIGPNGCGKSTLLKTIIGILPLKKGDIRLDGTSVRELSPKEIAKKVAYLSQGKNVPEITVERMVLHGRFPYLSYPRKYRKCDLEAAKTAMDKLGISGLAEKNLTELSGGMRQKVYLAMALCQGADVIMLDEPTTYLDISQQLKIASVIRELADEGKTVLTVSHDIISALKISDRLALMDEGKIIRVGSPEEILESGEISRLFNVEVAVFSENGEKEYYYKQRQDSI